MSSYSYISVRILLYMCPHTVMDVSSYYFICVLILVYIHTGAINVRTSRICSTLTSLISSVSSTKRMSRYATLYLSSYCYISVIILPYICPHTTLYLSSYYYICVIILLCVSSSYYMCVLMPLYLCSPYVSVLLWHFWYQKCLFKQKHVQVWGQIHSSMRTHNVVWEHIM